MSIEFLLTSFIVVASPGTGVLYTMGAGLTRGVRASVIAAVGCTLGILPHMALAVTGVAALFQASQTAFDVLKILGVAYLLFMAWNTLRDSGPLKVTDDLPPTTRQIITTGVLVNLLNPKLTIFFFAFLPQFVTGGGSGAFVRMVWLSLVFMLLTFIVFVAYGRFAAAIRNQVISRPDVMSWLRRVFAVGFVALAVRLGLESG
ncbi:LysE family translocator [Kineosporia mesophila]|uniref:LysE family translocator n=1 Tax=Kineosporia mesophila TaxID=566012 RepID=A0ABP7AAJ1_9ACTN|nr:LysE family translocator [Kineosporia mesophila]